MNILLTALERSTRLTASTKAEYRRCVSRFVEFAGASARNWTPLIVEAWRDHLARDEKGPGTVNKHLYALRYCSQRLEALGLGKDFARSAETMRAIKSKRRAMTIDEVRALMATCALGNPRDLRDRCIMQLALRTALRAQNLQAIKWENIDGRRLHVIQKGRRPHAPVLDDQSLAAIADWARWLEAHGGKTARGPVFRRISGPGVRDEWVLGPPIKGDKWLNRMIRKRAKAAGIRRSIHPHLFRHTAISWLLEAGVPPSRVMAQTGQTSMAVLSGYVTDLRADEDPVGRYLPEF